VNRETIPVPRSPAPAPSGLDARLRTVLWIKIGFTVVWALPLLLLPGKYFGDLGFPRPEPIIFAKLLGAAFLSLLVGYYRGVQAFDAGRLPKDTVVVGIVSNGLASALLTGYGVAGQFDNWTKIAPMFMAVSAAATALITAGLYAYRPR
jgi:hypothetical protein